jgi:hypothetical protein
VKESAVPLLFPVLFPPFFIFMWCMVGKLLGHLGGWQELHARYAYDDAMPADAWRMKSGKMGWVNYNNVLTVAPMKSGLALATFILFKIGHPPILIPWSDIKKVEMAKGWIMGHTQLTLSRIGDPEIRIYGPAGEAVHAAWKNALNAS